MVPIRKFSIGFCLIALAMFAAVPVQAQQGTFGRNGSPQINPPLVQRSAALKVRVTTGSLQSNGGTIVVLANVEITVTASKADCAITSTTTFNSCNFVYVNSAGTVANTSTKATAFAAGNAILAFVTTNGTEITAIRTPEQMLYGSALIVPTIVTNCTTGNCTTGQTQVLGGAARTIFFSGAAAAGSLSLSNLPFTSSTSYSCSGAVVAGSAGSESLNVFTYTSGAAAVARSSNGGSTSTLQGSCTGY